MHATWFREKGLFTCLYPPSGHELLMGHFYINFSCMFWYPGTGLAISKYTECCMSDANQILK